MLPCKTLINKLETYQKKMLKQILSPPTSTSDVAVYVISGFLQVEGQIDKKILTLPNNVARQDNTSVEKQIAIRQLTIKNEKKAVAGSYMLERHFLNMTWVIFMNI